jgi:lipooligosaccharide transport system permease protein
LTSTLPAVAVRRDRTGRTSPWHVTAYYARVYAKTWKSSVLSSFLGPVLYLVALGVGLGSIIDHGGRAANLGGVTYLQFVAPALVASTAMQIASGESLYPVMGAIKWNRVYHAMLATPLEVGDVLLGHLTWIALRITFSVGAYLAVAAAFGGVHSPWGIVAVPVGTLTGVAFAAPLMAFAATTDSENSFALVFRLAVIPLFLFSGTFFPISQLPLALRVLAEILPLSHGVRLCRDAALGSGVGAAAAGDLAYLVVLAVAGVVVARRAYSRRLRR